ncbi:hypothetical protein pipiens_001758 [Culex pipiens pipiens]|uniref:Uncharacterized protein n=1 Tax=Culex pipiens pipiens TaxID=38569 RepID=A0ABD1DVP0_CULPP
MSVVWTQCSIYQDVPGDAVRAGHDQDGSPIFVGRAALNETLTLPAKIIPDKQAAYVSHNGSELSVTHFEILRGTGFTWVQGSYGNVPSGAVPGGNSSSGELLYIGRAHHEDSLTLGKIHRSHGCMYIPFDGAELSFQEYEVLVKQQ